MDLLKDIRKASQVNAADQEEVDKLKEEVYYLRSEMSRLSDMVEHMAGALQQITGRDFFTTVPSTKKRKFESDHVSSFFSVGESLSSDEPPHPPDVPLLDPDSMASDPHLLRGGFTSDNQSGAVTPFSQKADVSESESVGSVDIVKCMFDFVNEDDGTDPTDCSLDQSTINTDFQPNSVESSYDFHRCVPYNDQAYNHHVSYDDDASELGQVQLDPKLSMKLNNAVSMLPKPLQESFVERIVQKIASPDAYQKHVDAVSVLATAAAIEAQNQIMISNAQANVSGGDGVNNTGKLSMNNQSEMTLPVAAAALGAFLAKYGNASAEEANKTAARSYEAVKL